MSPEVVAERIRMALAEAGRPDLAARVSVQPCPVCATRGAAIENEGLEELELELALRAGRLALADLELKLIDGVEATECRCAILYA